MTIENLKAPKFKAVAAKGAFVYCYLRTKDLTPYYVGVAAGTDPYRPIGKHNVVVPKDRKRIQILDSGLTFEEALEIEIFYIAKYGRKDIGTGILRNRTDGGEGRLGGPDMIKAAKKYGFEYESWKSFSEQKRAVIIARFVAGYRGELLLVETGKLLSHRMSIKYGISIEKWDSLSREQKNLFTKRFNSGKKENELFEDSISHFKRGQISGKTRRNEAIKKYGVSAKEFDLWSKEWKSIIAQRYSTGNRGEDLLKKTNGNDQKLKEAAHKCNLSVNYWASLSRKERARIMYRFKSGKRGDELLSKEIKNEPESTAAKYNMTLKEWEGLNRKEKNRESERYRTKIQKAKEFGITPEEYEGLSNGERGSFMTMKKTAEKLGIDFNLWRSLDTKIRKRIDARYRRGKRGKELTEGI